MEIGALKEAINQVLVKVNLPEKKVEAKRPVASLVKKPEVQQEPANEEIRRAIEEITRQLGASKQLRMYYDDDIKKVVVSVMEEGSQKVIRQIPSAEFLSFIKRFTQYLGMLFERNI
jgi:uncharacterized FlaG/YvyC family protein